MALTKCKECGKEVSTYAELCPHCGAKQKKSTLGCGGAILVLIILGFVASQLNECNQKYEQKKEAVKQEGQQKTQDEKDRNYSQPDEKAQLRNSFFGDYKKANIIKKMGKSELQVWEPYIKYSKTLPPVARQILLEGVEKLQVEYDEIWKAEYDSIFTTAEKKKWKGQFDRNTLYWKDNKIQACTLEKFYFSNPSTGKKLTPPTHKLVNIYDRAYILNKFGFPINGSP